MNRTSVQAQLKELASVLALPALTPCLDSPVPRIPTPTLRRDLRCFFNSSVDCATYASPLHDVVLTLADRTVPAHSIILRRSPFFTALLQPSWSSSRWTDGKIGIELSHLRWDVLAIHLRHLYCDEGVGEFMKGLDTDKNQDEWLDYLTEVLGASNELLLDRLKLMCSSLLRARISPTNIAALLTISDTFYALPLKEVGLLYCAQNLESLLEGGMLDDLEHRMVRDVSLFVKRKQDERLHRSIHETHLTALIAKHQKYYDTLDLPPPSLNLSCHKVLQRPTSSRKTMRVVASPVASPDLRPTSSTQDTAVFEMDEELAGIPSLGVVATRSRGPQSDQPSLSRLPKVTTKSAAAPWLSKRSEVNIPSVADNEKTSGIGDLRSIMAAEKARASDAVLPSGSRGGILSNTPLRLPSAPVATEGSISAAIPPDLASLTITPKMSQKDRKRLAHQQLVASPHQDGDKELADKPTPGKASAWRTMESTPRSSGTRVWPEPHVATRVFPCPCPTVEATHYASSGPTGSPTLGPTFTPTKSSAPPLSRSVSDAVWSKANASLPSHAAFGIARSQSTSQGVPTIRTLASSPSPAPGASSSGLKFAEIQAQQEAAAVASESLAPRKKSFAEIQAEALELELERARAETERLDFERWFEEESKRVKAEEKAVSRQTMNSTGTKVGKKKSGMGSQGHRIIKNSKSSGKAADAQGRSVAGYENTADSSGDFKRLSESRKDRDRGGRGGTPLGGGKQAPAPALTTEVTTSSSTTEVQRLPSLSAAAPHFQPSSPLRPP